MDIFDLGLGGEAVSEIEDVTGLSAHGVEQIEGGLVGFFRGAGEDEGIEITLDADGGGELGASAGEVHGPVKTEDLSTTAEEFLSEVGFSFWEEDDGEAGGRAAMICSIQRRESS